MEPIHESPPPVWPLVQELVAVGGLLHDVITHMEAFDASGAGHPEAPPVPVVLATLLTEVLAPYGAARRAAIDAAAEVLADVLGILEDELLLVTPEPADADPGRRRRGTRSRPLRRRRPGGA